eukprot:gene8918-11925_t
MLPLSLYQRALGPAYQRLAPALARFHGLSGPHRLVGQVQVEAPATWAGRVLAWALAGGAAGAQVQQLLADEGVPTALQANPGDT